MRESPAEAASLILALETSCDDTCAAVVETNGLIRANVISSQGVHERFGGVVPEIASRHHLELVNLIVAQALSEAGVTLDDIALVGATQGPGLVGALLGPYHEGQEGNPPAPASQWAARGRGHKAIYLGIPASRIGKGFREHVGGLLVRPLIHEL